MHLIYRGYERDSLTMFKQPRHDVGATVLCGAVCTDDSHGPDYCSDPVSIVKSLLSVI